MRLTTLVSVAALLVSTAAFAASQPDTGPTPVASPTPAAPTAPIAAPDATSTVQQAAQKPVADEDPMICRNEILTGSNFTQRVCERRSVREARRKQDAHVLQNVQQHTGMNTGH